MSGEVRVIPLLGIPELEEGDDLAALLAQAAERVGGLAPGDVLVVAQKAVSKVEGRVVHLGGVEPSAIKLQRIIFSSGVISETVGANVNLIDSGAATARDVETLLEKSSLTHDEPLGLYQERSLCDDLDHFYVTDAAERFSKVAERFLGSSPAILEAVEVWGHDELRTY